jgi:hypothetical protein
MDEEVEITYGHSAVWVNTSVCLGRFGIMGIDVHSNVAAQIAGEQKCLYCTHAKTTIADWHRFIIAMKEFCDQPIPIFLSR